MSAFPDPTGFPFLAALESNWQRIHAEFLAVQHELANYVEAHLYDRGWQVVGLWNLPHREVLPASPLRCPQTAALMQQHVPSHGAVAFSVLEPWTHIRPHFGHPGPYLRAHLGLEVPAGDCGIRVGDQTRCWAAGRALVLDDRLEHEAWNRSPARRVVLLFDFIP